MESFQGIQQQEAIEVGSYRSRDLERPELERELRGIQQLEANGVGGYRSRSLEKAVPKIELSGDTAARGYRSRRL